MSEADKSSDGDQPPTPVRSRTHYSPPWADVSIIGIAGSSGSGKSTLSNAIVKRLSLPWVVILSMVREYAGRFSIDRAYFVNLIRTPFTNPFVPRLPSLRSETNMISILLMHLTLTFL